MDSEATHAAGKRYHSHIQQPKTKKSIDTLIALPALLESSSENGFIPVDPRHPAPKPQNTTACMSVVAQNPHQSGLDGRETSSIWVDWIRQYNPNGCGFSAIYIYYTYIYMQLCEFIDQ